MGATKSQPLSPDDFWWIICQMIQWVNVHVLPHAWHWFHPYDLRTLLSGSGQERWATSPESPVSVSIGSFYEDSRSGVGTKETARMVCAHRVMDDPPTTNDQNFFGKKRRKLCDVWWGPYLSLWHLIKVITVARRERERESCCSGSCINQGKCGLLPRWWTAGLPSHVTNRLMGRAIESGS
jgi:hypothetical protein